MKTQQKAKPENKEIYNLLFLLTCTSRTPERQVQRGSVKTLFNNMLF
jgi:hypothetical protein